MVLATWFCSGIEHQIRSLEEQARPKTLPRKPGWSHRRSAIRQKRLYRDLSLIGGGMDNQCTAPPSTPTRLRSKAPARRRPLLREREPGGMGHDLETFRQAQLSTILGLLPQMEKSVREMEQSSPEWADSPKLAEAKQTLDTMQRLREQYGRTEPKQREALGTP